MTNKVLDYKSFVINESKKEKIKRDELYNFELNDKLTTDGDGNRRISGFVYPDLRFSIEINGIIKSLPNSCLKLSELNNKVFNEVQTDVYDYLSELGSNRVKKSLITFKKLETNESTKTPEIIKGRGECWFTIEHGNFIMKRFDDPGRALEYYNKIKAEYPKMPAPSIYAFNKFWSEEDLEYTAESWEEEEMNEDGMNESANGNIKKLTANVIEFLESSGYDVNKVKNALDDNTTTFAIERVSKKRGETLGIDFKYPYEIYNPYNIDIKMNECSKID